MSSRPACVLVLAMASACVEARLDRAACTDVVSRWETLGRREIGGEYGDFVAERRERFVGACRSYGTQAYVDCALAAERMEVLAQCAQGGLQPAKSRGSAGVPAPADCEAQADHRLALHGHFELPSISRAMQKNRANMVDTCNGHWSAGYVDCILGSPSPSHVDACEAAGRVRTRPRG